MYFGSSITAIFNIGTLNLLHFNTLKIAQSNSFNLKLLVNCKANRRVELMEQQIDS